MLTLKIDSLAGIDGSMLDKITERLAALADRSPQPPFQQKIWLAYLAAIPKFRHSISDLVDLPSPSAVDSLAVRKIAEIEARDTETAAFWIEVTEHMNETTLH
jgi:hypothetical protein